MTAHALTSGRRRLSPFRFGAVVVCSVASLTASGPRLSAQPAEPAAESAEDRFDDSGLFLPVDRLRQRQLEQARRLSAAGRWSDVAELCDKILESPRDVFLREPGDEATLRSLKGDVGRLLQSQPQAGREAYELLFGPRASRMLDEAIAADDPAAVLAVARRWFDTPAGRRAALIAAVSALETDQPAVASAWLERLAATGGVDRLEPTLAVMRAVARYRSGDGPAAEAILKENRRAAGGAVRVAGRDVSLSSTLDTTLPWLGSVAGASPADGEWLQSRGDPARNALADASRPLLAPRYRVPLTRHPEEARLLEVRRRSSAERGLPLMPAGSPLAVDGLILTRTPLGILAVDFTTGKRLWLQTGAAGPADRPGDAADEAGLEDSARDGLGRVFDDATTAGLTCAGGLVFAIESPSDSAATFEHTQQLGMGMGRRGGDGVMGNTLAAYAVAGKGAARWRVPAAPSTTWYLGPPLAVGGDLYVLAEEKGEIRLDVLDATHGAVIWSQPLAELEADRSVTHAAARGRRRAGLSPAMADGVLVCPLGAGAVTAIDLATRTLLWAFRYDSAAVGPQAPGMLGRPVGGPDPSGEPRAARLRDSLPVITGGRVLLTPYDSDELLCLDLREGTPAWEERIAGGLMIAGVVDGRVIVLGTRGVEALSLDSGRRLWTVPLDGDQGGDRGRLCGRGILTADRFYVPLDTPEILEIGVADGTIMGRCPARGGVVPGNLVAYRGEIISRGLDSLDVFHQAAPLESRIRTARRENPASSWASQWSGQLSLEAGNIAEGLAELMRASQSPDCPLAPEIMADAVIFGMQRDFAAVAPLWRDALRSTVSGRGENSPVTRAAVRAATDGFLRHGDFTAAWEAVRDTVFGPPSVGGDDLVRDPSDPALAVTEDRWLRGRIAELRFRAAALLRDRIEKEATEAVETASADPDAASRVARLERIADRLGGGSAARIARARIIVDLDRLIAAERESSDDRLALRRDLHRLALLQTGDGLPPEASTDPDPVQGADGAGVSTDAAWPLGRVVTSRPPAAADPPDQDGRERRVTHAVATDESSPHAHLSIACDEHQGRLQVLDAYGRAIGEPLAIDHAARRLGLPWAPRESEVEASTIGRLMFVRVGGSLTACDLGRSGERRLWSRGPAQGTRRELPVAPWSRVIGGRLARDGHVPLGLEISEPDGAMRGQSPPGARARTSGVLRADVGSLGLFDPLSGAALWERHQLPDVNEMFGDEDFVCLCTAAGRESLVISMHDGRIVRSFVAPHTRQRLGAWGRRIVSVRPLATQPGRQVADRVRLELLDPVTLEVTALGDVDGESRAVMAAADHLVAVTPAGELTAFDLRRGRVAFHATLPEMPAAFDRLDVVSWEDRYLVLAGGRVQSRPAAVDRDPPAEHDPADRWLPGLGGGPAVGAIWAVHRSTGELIWSTPARIEHHWLHVRQPAGLPVLFLSRQIPNRGDRDQPRLSLIGLDKRTGHAVFMDDMLPVQPDMVQGYEMAGDPERHTITLREFGALPWQVMLEFSGQGLPPQPPYKAGHLLEQIRRSGK